MFMYVCIRVRIRICAFVYIFACSYEGKKSSKRNSFGMGRTKQTAGTHFYFPPSPHSGTEHSPRRHRQAMAGPSDVRSLLRLRVFVSARESRKKECAKELQMSRVITMLSDTSLLQRCVRSLPPHGAASPPPRQSLYGLDFYCIYISLLFSLHLCSTPRH